MPQPRPGKYFIHCEFDPIHRALDLPSQYAHRDDGLVQAITANRTEYQKWVIEAAAGAEGVFTVRANIGGKCVEPDRGTAQRPLPSGADRNADGILLAYFPAEPGNEYQRWIFEETEKPDVYYVRNVGSGKYWDLRVQDPSHIQQLPKKEVVNQRWILRVAN